MKQEATKKSKLWLWLVIGLAALLVIGGVVGAILLLGGGEKAPAGPQGGRPNLYWNIDKKAYTENSESGLSTREPGEDGLYKVRFAYNGQVVEYPVVDKPLINYIDTMDCMGLVTDADGVVVDAVAPKEIATEVNKNAYVKDVRGESIVINTSVAMNGMNITVKLNELTEIYDVTPEADVPGRIMDASELKAMDTVAVYANDMEQVTHVFITSHAKQSKVYWRADQFYNSTEKSTTRVPDENGVYTMPFYCEGETVELKFKDKALVTKIDSASRWKCHYGLTFDEEGYVIEQYVSALGIQGIIVADCWDIVEINGDEYTIQRLTTNDGSSWTGTIPADCVIYEASAASKSDKRGGEQIYDLRIGDRVTVWTNTAGEVILVYVSNRLVDSPAYFVPTRKYSSSKKESTRTIGASGYYEVELVKEGTTFTDTYYIKDKDVVDYFDSLTDKVVGLRVGDNKVIEAVYNTECLTGYTTATRGGCVTAVTGGIFTKISYGKRGTDTNLVLAANARVYNVSQYGTIGEETTIMPGDHVYAHRQPTGEILLLYVTKRETGAATLYWNQKLMYDKTAKETTREADENGWYWYDMAVQGKQVRVRTNNKKFANKIDSQSIGAIGLSVSGDVITQVFDPTYAYSGNKVASGYRYRSITSDGKYHCVYNSDNSKTVDFVMADDCVIYNVSAACDEFKGERIYSLKYNDMITAFCDIYGEAKVVYVRNRDVDKIYWKTDRFYDSTNKVTTREPDADGYYWLDLAVDGGVKTFKCNRQDVVTSIDSYDGAFGLHVKDDEILGFVSTSNIKNVKGNSVIGYTVKKIEGEKVTVVYNKAGSTFGTEKVIYVNSATKVYDVSPTAEKFGGEIKLQVGDTFRSYLTRDSKYDAYIYVQFHANREGGEYGYCEVCKKEVQWYPWAGGAVPTVDGTHVYLNASTTAFSQTTMATSSRDYTVCMDLNGKVLTRQAPGRAFRVSEGETLNIIDSVGGGKIITNGGNNYSGGMAMLSAGGKFNIYGGTFEFVQSDYVNGYGGNFYVSGTGTELNLYDGVITGGVSTAQNKEKNGYGGNIYVVASGTFNMYGGAVTNGKAVGIMYESEKDGKITYATMSPCGGNIYLSESGNMNITGGVIENGHAVRDTFEYTVDGETKTITNLSYGGNIYKTSGKGAVSVKDITITGGEAHRGGNIYGGTGILNFENATISNGVATQFGGNIMSVGGDWTLTNTKILDGKNPSCGGNIYSQGGVYTLENTTVSGGKAGTGGNVYLYKNKSADNIFTVKEGSVIKDGVATQHGGNIYIKNKNYVLNADGKAVDPKEAPDGTPLLPTLNLEGGKIIDGICDANGTGDYYGGNIYVAGHLNVSGGEISGGLQGTNDYEIYIPGEGAQEVTISGGTIVGKLRINGPKSLVISGAPKLGQLNLRDTLVTLGELTEGADIAVLSNKSVFSNPSDKAQDYVDAGYFKGFNLGEGVGVTANNELTIIKVELPTKEGYCQHCDQVVTWRGWSYGSGDKVEDDGHFYLPKNLSISTNTRIGTSSSNTAADAHHVILDLNGYNITSTGPVFYVYPYSSLSILDTVGTGYLEGKGVLRNDKPGAGGVLYAEKGTLNLYSGTFTLADGEKVSNGGVINSSGTVNVYGGTLNGNTINGVGSAIYASSGAVNVAGGEINGEIYTKAAISLSGAPVIETLTMSSGLKANVGELTTGASITVNATGVFTESFEKAKEYAEAGYFKSVSGEEIIVTELNELSVGSAEVPGQRVYFCEHCQKNAAWIPYDQTAANGHFYVPDEGFTMESQKTIEGASYNLCLDLNGATLTRQSGGRAFRVSKSATLNIMDTKGTGKIVSNGGPAHSGTVAMLSDGGKLNLYSGTLEFVYTEYRPINGGIITMSGSETVFNMYGGTLTGGEVKSQAADKIASGGNVQVSSSATFNMYGGTITGGKAYGVLASSEKNGVVTYTAVTAYGGNIGMADTAKVNIYGGIIENGQAIRETFTYTVDGEEKTASNMPYGGNIYKAAGDNGTLLIKDATVSGGIAHRGGNIYGDNGVYTLENAIISGGKTSQYGGNIMSLGGTWTITDSQILDGETTSHGGNIYSQGGVYTLEGTTVSGGNAAAGGNIYLYKNKTDENVVTVKDGTVIKDGVATQHGGNIYIKNKNYVLNADGKAVDPKDAPDGTPLLPTLNVEGGQIINGVCDSNATGSYYGGNIYVAGHLNISGGEISGGLQGTNGYDIYVSGDGEQDVVISGGTVAGKLRSNGPKSLTISGAPKIGELNLKDTLITVGELTEGADIAVLSNKDIFSLPCDKAQTYVDAGYFTAFNSSMVLGVSAANELTLSVPTTLKWCEHCMQNVEWVEYDPNNMGSTKFTTDAHYYLPTGGYTHSQQYTINEGVSIVIDLNGQTLTGTTDKRVFLQYGELSVMDSATGGKIETSALHNAEGYGNGGLAMMSKTATLNLYGGTLTTVAGHNPASSGGILGIVSANATLNMYGGEILGGSANNNGQNVYLGEGTVNMEAGFIDGGVYASATANINLSGSAKIANTNGGLTLAEGAKIGLDTMTDAEVFVSGAEGAITDVLANADEYMDNIKAADTEFEIVNASGVLTLVDNSAPFDPNKVHTLADAMDFTTTDPDGKVSAKCPVCREIVVWQPLPASQGTSAVAITGGHFYLDASTDYTANTMQYSNTSQQSVCLHLNGQNMTSTARVFYNEKATSVLNFMGSGTVSGVGISSNTRAALDLTASVNLYGGNFVGTDANYPTIENRASTHTGSILSIYEGASVTHAAGGVAIQITKKGNLNICGGTVGTVFNKESTGSFTVSGAPVIENLDLSNGAKITVGELTDGADITVTATGVFTEDMTDPNAARGYFNAAETGKSVIVDGSALAIGEVQTLVCPHCGLTDAELEAAGTPWAEWNFETYSKGTIPTGHYYLTETKENAKQYYIGTSVDDDVNNLSVDVVIDMRGFDIISEARAFYYYTNNHLTLFDSVGGSEVVGKANSSAGVIYVGDGGSNASFKAYGITFSEKYNGDRTASASVISLASPNYAYLENCIVNGGTATSGGAITLSSTGTLELVNTTVNGGTVTGNGGAINLGKGTLIVDNSTIVDGTAASGKGVYVTEGKVVLKDGAVVGNIMMSNATGTVELSGNATVADLNLISGAKITKADLTGGASVTVVADGVFTAPLTNAESVKDYFFADGKEITVTTDGELAATVPASAQLVYACPHCNGADATWVPYDIKSTDGTLAGTGEHYYIPDGGYEQDKQYTITGEVIIDLHGQTLKSYDDKRMWRIKGGNLSIIDSVGGGQAVADCLPSNGGGLLMTDGTNPVINLYSGALIMTADCNEASNGGVMNLASNAVFNMYGGTVSGGKIAAEGKGHNINASKGTINISGGTIDGGIYVSEDSAINVSDTAKITKTNGGVILETGKTIGLEAMSGDAEVYVTAEGVFTGTLTDAASYLTYIKSASDDAEVVVENDTLAIAAKVVVDNRSIYEKAKEMDFSGADADGKVTAKCPVCEATVDWYPMPTVAEADVDMTQATDKRCVKMSDGAHHHYYLSESKDYTQNVGYYYLGSATKVCLNLNGQTVVSTRRAFYTETDNTVLNIMGEGVVRGTGTGAANRGVMDLCRETNLYGGTYESTDPTSPAVVVRGASTLCRVSVYEGTTINATAGAPAIYLTGSTSAKMNSLNICGGTINGKVYTDKTTSAIEVSGAPVIADLDLTGGYLLTVGELTEGASIQVTVEKDVAFTNEIAANAETYATYFFADELKTGVVAKENKLVLTNVCPHCNVPLTDITWTEIVNTDAAQTLSESGHYKLTENVSAASGNVITTPEKTSSTGLDIVVDTCSFDVTSAKGRTFYVNKYNKLTVFDSVGGSEAVSNSTNNALGGSCVYAHTGAEANIYDLTFYGAAGANGAGNCVSAYGTTSKVNIYSGTFIGTDNTTDGVNGGVIMNKGIMTIYGGTFNSVQLTNGEGDTLYSTGTLVIYGGEFAGEVYVADGNVTVSGDPKINQLNLAAEKLVTFGELNTGADITVNAVGAFSVANENAQAYVDALFVKPVTGKTITVTDNVMTMANA